MRISEIETRITDDGFRLSAAVERANGSGPTETYFEYETSDRDLIGNVADAFAAATLLPAMRAGEPLEIVPRISPRLHFNLPRIRDVFVTWWPHLSRIDILTSPERDTRPPGTDGATCFSGGVDSFFSLLRRQHDTKLSSGPISHLINLRGVESRLQDMSGSDETESWLREIASQTRTELILGETNIRTTLQGRPGNLHWERHYVGSALAAVTLALAGRLRYACIPSGYAYGEIGADGSTPLTDEMYSTDRMFILHDGADTSRPEKTRAIVEWEPDLVLEHLRVCTVNGGGAHNCGRCYKCVRTAIPLHILGVWDRAATFRDKSTGHWERVIADDHLSFLQENLDFAVRHGAEARMIRMLRRAIRRRRWRDAELRKRLSTFARQAGLSPVVRSIRRRSLASEGRGLRQRLMPPGR